VTASYHSGSRISVNRLSEPGLLFFRLSLSPPSALRLADTCWLSFARHSFQGGRADTMAPRGVVAAALVVQTTAGERSLTGLLGTLPLEATWPPILGKTGASAPEAVQR